MSTTNAPKLSIGPTSKLSTKVKNPQTKREDSQFPLQTKAWLQMQVVVNKALAFPFSAATFTNDYGAFTDQATILSAVKVLKSIKTTANEYGDPATLLSNITKFQQASTAPRSIYGNAVWLAYNTQTTAQQIGKLLNLGLSDIGTIKDPKQRKEDLKELLTGPGQIIDQATTLKNQIIAFSKKVENFYNVLNADLTGPTDSLKAYLGRKGNVLSLAQSDVKQDTTNIKSLNSKISKLNEEYIGFTTAASLSPLFLLIPAPPLNVVLAVADAAGFATAAVIIHQDITKDKDELAADKKDKIQKGDLVTQLTGFNIASQSVEMDGKLFLNAIGQMESGWTEFVVQIKKQLKSLTVKDVEDWPAFLDQINFKASLVAWTQIASAAVKFASAGFITFKSGSL